LKPIIRSLAVLSVLLTASCGGTRFEVANDTGRDFVILSIDIGGEKLQWSEVENEDTVSGSLRIPDAPVPPVATIEWDDGTGIHDETVCLLDSAASANKIWIHLAPDATSLSYRF
jgi:hypothetical protein